MDPRLRLAVDASHAWYDDVFAVHRVPTAVEGGVWRSLGEPPRWHSVAKTLEPLTDPAPVLAAVEGFAECSVADSFGLLDLSGAGWELLFEASWLHHPGTIPSRTLPPGWSVVADEDLLRQWNDRHDTAGVLVPAMLAHPRFTVLAQHDGGVLAGGAVLHDVPGEAVGLSNAWSVPGRTIDPAALLACAAFLHPGRGVVDYARGPDLDAMVEAGFAELGPQVVWLRQHARTDGDDT